MHSGSDSFRKNIIFLATAIMTIYDMILLEFFEYVNIKYTSEYFCLSLQKINDPKFGVKKWDYEFILSKRLVNIEEYHKEVTF